MPFYIYTLHHLNLLNYKTKLVFSQWNVYLSVLAYNSLQFQFKKKRHTLVFKPKKMQAYIWSVNIWKHQATAVKKKKKISTNHQGREDIEAFKKEVVICDPVYDLHLRPLKQKKKIKRTPRKKTNYPLQNKSEPGGKWACQDAIGHEWGCHASIITWSKMPGRLQSRSRKRAGEVCIVSFEVQKQYYVTDSKCLTITLKLVLGFSLSVEYFQVAIQVSAK